MPADSGSRESRSGAKGAYFTVWTLSATYAFSFLDRQLPNLFLQSIKRDLHLTDTQVSLLTGLAFSLLYSFAALPLSYLADRWSRKRVIALGVLIWGAATTVCGFAATPVQFFLARTGVGFGESALSPATYSLIADIFPPERRARPMAIFAAGAAIGTGLAMLAGAGAIGIAERLQGAAPALLGGIASWRLVLAGVGLFTLGLLAFIWHITDPKPVRTDAAAIPSFGEVLILMWRDRRAYAPILIGIPLINIAYFGFITWAPAFFMRTHGWTVAQAGVGLGMASVLGGITGAACGGWLSAALNRRSPDVPLLVSLAAMACFTVLASMIALASSAVVQLILVGCIMAVMFPVGVMGAISVQQIAPPFARAQVSSVYLLVSSLVGVGIGPTLVALVTDYGFHDDKAVGNSIALVCVFTLCVSAATILLNRHPFVGVSLSRRSVQP